MEDHTPRILIVDDEPFNIEILLEYLDDSDYELETAEDGLQAWQRLEADPEAYDVVILDRMMPHMNGMEVLTRIKSHPLLQSVPVILQTALAAKDEILEGIRAGAFYYLTKPFEEQLLRSVLGIAVEDRLRYKRLQRESDVAGRTFGLMFEGRFRFRTLEAARDLASVLANACPDPKKAIIGMSELLINAVEHGNLGITYDEKSVLRAQDRWQEEVQRRLQDPRYADRHVEVSYRRENDVVHVTITDQGDGFDWEQYLEVDPARAFDTHGRGIAMSRLISFDTLEYQGKGNRVTVSVALDQAAAEDAA